ncbi:MAG: hypothetical protein HKN47_07745 [Pirellulaceae bacterium]|nr:hypothetical protein [Pirellulaceae bacterium]
MVLTDQLRDAIQQAKAAWQGCDWHTEFGPHRIDLHGLRSRQAELAAKATRGQESECWREAAQWLAAVERDSLRAAELADLALEAAQSGQFEAAARIIAEVVALEQKYHEAYAYEQVREMTKAWLHGEPLSY